MKKYTKFITLLISIIILGIIIFTIKNINGKRVKSNYDNISEIVNYILSNENKTLTDDEKKNLKQRQDKQYKSLKKVKF